MRSRALRETITAGARKPRWGKSSLRSRTRVADVNSDVASSTRSRLVARDCEGEPSSISAKWSESAAPAPSSQASHRISSQERNSAWTNRPRPREATADSTTAPTGSCIQTRAASETQIPTVSRTVPMPKPGPRRMTARSPTAATSTAATSVATSHGKASLMDTSRRRPTSGRRRVRCIKYDERDSPRLKKSRP